MDKKTFWEKEKPTIISFLIFIAMCIVFYLSSIITLEIDRKSDVVEYNLKNRYLKVITWEKKVIAEYYGQFTISECKDDYVIIEFYENGFHTKWYVLKGGDITVSETLEEPEIEK